VGKKKYIYTITLHLFNINLFSHTFCEECLKSWLEQQNFCPMCRGKIIKKQLGKDLVAYSIINDMPLSCNNTGMCINLLSNILDCPWKGPLSELVNHLKSCYFDPKRMSVNVKKKLSSSDNNNDFDKKTKVINPYEEEDQESGNYLNFNPNSSLKARLYQKNPTLMGKVLTNTTPAKETDDTFNMIEQILQQSKATAETNKNNNKDNNMSACISSLLTDTSTKSQDSILNFSDYKQSNNNNINDSVTGKKVNAIEEIKNFTFSDTEEIIDINETGTEMLIRRKRSNLYKL
jgi:hypothetical protein